MLFQQTGYAHAASTCFRVATSFVVYEDVYVYVVDRSTEDTTKRFTLADYKAGPPFMTSLISVNRLRSIILVPDHVKQVVTSSYVDEVVSKKVVSSSVVSFMVHNEDLVAETIDKGLHCLDYGLVEVRRILPDGRF